MSGGVRHVWVRPAFTPVESPGLVLDWRRDPDGWQALVTWIEPRGGRITTEWTPVDQLRPAESHPRTGSAYDN